ncbi:MAG: 7-carboxy-7-deazaguanine synthase QueE [Phycisphaerales bacterium]
MTHALPQLDAVTLPISETFTSIQGEGKLTGVPSHFIRTSGCNLRCAWCDTPYASWAPEGTRRSVADLVDEARASGVRHAVLTGGEPMMFPEIEPLANALREAGMHITIETAGTIARDIACDLMSISPKLANSTPADDPRDPDGVWARRHEDRRLNPDALRTLWSGAWDRQCKFVVTSERDMDEIRDVAALLGDHDPADILLMPEGVTPPTATLSDTVQRLCRAHGYRYCARLHIELYGDTRGT